MRDRRAVYGRLERRFESGWGSAGPLRRFTAPGRTELGGNHTDHNHGKVLAAAIQLEAAAVVQAHAGRIEIASEGWNHPFLVDLGDLSPRSEEVGTTEALIRGVVAEFERRGLAWGGFRACVESSVLPGSGLSSSAAFEVLVGSILSGLYNQSSLSAVDLALIGQTAENVHFGKPCGLMDQMASALGGVVSIDFQHPGSPQVRQLEVDFQAAGYSLCIVNTHGSHADLTPAYAAITSEMRMIARHFGQETLREVNEGDFWPELRVLMSQYSHRAVLRAVHFFEENRRVDAMVESLKSRNWDRYLDLVGASGRSSAQYLQNVWAAPTEQSLAVALALTERFLGGEGACRVHGGGFAGTIQAYVPLKRRQEYAKTMESLFGAGAVFELTVRPEPAGEDLGRREEST